MLLKVETNKQKTQWNSKVIIKKNVTVEEQTINLTAQM